MGFLKKNYEKILLGLVLLGLVVALAALPVWINSDREEIDKMTHMVIGGTPKQLEPLDLTRQNDIVTKVQAPYALDLETGNKVFNPFPWQKALDGHLIKIKNGSEVGGGAVTVTQITPLYFILTLDSVTTNELGARYTMSVERQASANPSQRRKTSRSVSKGDVKNDVFLLREVKGPPEDPTELVFQLNDTSELVSVSKDKPFRRVDGYSADLKYDPEARKWTALREGSPPIKFAGDDYIIVAINKSEVILSAKSNQKKYTRPYNP